MCFRHHTRCLTPADTIRRLVEQSAGRIEIAAGGGVDEATVGELGMLLSA
jgi:copper homeostasis protein CutC